MHLCLPQVSLDDLSKICFDKGALSSSDETSIFAMRSVSTVLIGVQPWRLTDEIFYSEREYSHKYRQTFASQNHQHGYLPPFFKS